MRPRHKAAENAIHLRRLADESDASMRPRHKAAENHPGDTFFALMRETLQ